MSYTLIINRVSSQKLPAIKTSPGSDSLEKPSMPLKFPLAKTNSLSKRERTSSGRSNLGEMENVDRKLGRKVSLMSPKSEHGSAKNRRVSKMERGDLKGTYPQNKGVFCIYNFIVSVCKQKSVCPPVTQKLSVVW